MSRIFLLIIYIISFSKLYAESVTFYYSGSASSVILAGSFNNWNSSDPEYKMKKQGRQWAITINLSPGEYQYKYVIDGKWPQDMSSLLQYLDPEPTGYVADGYGGRNALIVISGDDIESDSENYLGNFSSIYPDMKHSLKLEEGWYKNRVFYHIWVKAFSDSNGDGIGDIRGIIKRLDYLNDGNEYTDSDLGVNAIWLSPVFECTYKGDNMHGYDTVDYYRVNPIFGNENDLILLIDEAHKRGIAVIFDFVFNHTSNKHPWFLESSEGGAKRDWYIWNSRPETSWQRPWGGGSWRDVWHLYSGSYYYAAFASTMPDLNLRNSEVRENLSSILVYWLNRGFDGVRIDAVRYGFENGPFAASDISENHFLFKAIRKNIIDSYVSYGTAKMMVAEAWTHKEGITPYGGDGNNEFNMCFDFPRAYEIRNSVHNESNAGSNGLDQIIEYQQREYKGSFYPATFLSNHDEVVSRPMTDYNSNSGKSILAAALMFSTPGTPFIYYGNEIGMKDGQSGGDRRLRTDMEWGKLSSEIKDISSILNMHKKLIRARLTEPALINGKYIRLNSDNNSVYTFARSLNRVQTIIAVFNLSGKHISCRVKTKGVALQSTSGTDFIDGDEYEVESDTIQIDSLKPYQFLLISYKK